MRWALGGKGTSVRDGKQALADRVSRLRTRGLEWPRGLR